MFSASEVSTKKKSYQKPNILRRKPKSPVTQTNVTNASNLNQPVITFTTTSKNVNKGKTTSATSFVDSKITSGVKTNGINTLISGQIPLNNNNDEDVSQNCVNVELFLNNSDNSQHDSQYDIDSEIDTNTRNDWCFDFTNVSQGIVIGSFNTLELGSELGQSTVAMVPLSEIPTTNRVNQELNTDVTNKSILPQNLTIEYLANGTMNFKCDAPNCNKRFKSEQKLNKHKLVHSPGGAKPDKQTIFQCPVKKVTDGVEVACGNTFPARNKLVEHLNTEHSPSDALYVCGSCGRGFFWASGLRVHGRAGCGGGSAVCGWPGCGAAFRHPCRLREHARKHTGDKPYPCQYPNCGWSFRTASKLVRHARRHTGERRHACAACGRAFPRAEHLRDHLARHHRRPHTCSHAGCQRKFTNIGALVTHMKKVHNEDPPSLEEYIAQTTTPVEQTITVESENVEVREELPEEVLVEGGEEGGAMWRAARTHCTWPLATRAHDYVGAADYVLEEDVQVELSEGSESNIYTVRSDLFLHGNVLNNEDSEHMPVAGEADAGDEAEESVETSHAIDADLSLLDTHPTIDLMQEELLYADAVDESSFRVFLLSGEEIQIV